MEEVKKKRGRPRKTPLIELPLEIKEVIKEVKLKEETIEDIPLTKQEIQEVIEEVEYAHRIWDYPISKTPDYFDASESFELTGYKPITDRKGLDFNPDWFTEARDTFKRTGHYTTYPRNTRAYAQYWDREYDRCRDGMTVNGYTITGDHYFFLNYYLLMDLTSAKKAGAGRVMDFPKFFVAQYEWFHYVEMCKRLRKNAIIMKSRGVGYSEIDACIVANSYNCRPLSINLVCALQSLYLDKTLDKVWNALAFLNDYTDGGFFKLRLVHDTQYLKRASVYRTDNGQKIESGWMSLILGIVADKPNKIRGDRTDILVFEEMGSWPDSQKAFILAQSLLGGQGSLWGILLGGGTGGDSGPALEGLRHVYYEPRSFDVLPYKHSYTQSGNKVETAFFLPCHIIVNDSDYMDSRGYTNPEEGMEYYMKLRAKYSKNPKALLTESAEHCFYAEEAFSMEGNNNFDKVIIAELLAAIRLTKTAPKIEKGSLSYTYRNGLHTKENINGYRWEELVNGKIHILEHPIWTDLYRSKFKGDEEAPIYDTMNNLYVAGIDSIDIGLEDTSENTDNPSKFCITIMRRQFGLLDPVIVAYYMDRPEHIRDAYKIAMCLSTYYLAIINIEATRVNMLAWAREKGFYNYFMMRPKATYPDPTKINKRTPGTPATPTIIDHLLKLIESYIEDYGHHIWFEEMLDELSRYSLEEKTHFDIVASLGMLMLANEELGNLVATKVVKKVETYQDVGYYTDENGYKRWGIIPKKNNLDIIINNDRYVEGPRTSDPRSWGR